MTMQNDDELLARFLGGTKHVANGSGKTFWRGIFGLDDIVVVNLDFQTSWDWLMSVVEKIEKDTLFQVTIHTAYTNISGEFNGEKYNRDSCFRNGYTKIDVTYYAVVRFLRWYNENMV